MRILVINGGSSSIKFSIFDASHAELALIEEGELGGMGTPAIHLVIDGAEQPSIAGDSLDRIFAAISGPVDAIGYRVVHPGPKLRDHQRITPEVLVALDHAIAFAPLHDPAVLHIIRAGMARFPNLPHYACFDTVFHQTMPLEATTYAIPLEYRQQGIRRFGFHGLSCESVVRAMQPFPRRAVIAHLGSGCSVTALLDGRSIDNTMGLTPTGGVVMGTRPGDLDPGLLFYLIRQQKGDAVSATEAMLNHASGLVALSNLPNDMKQIRQARTPDTELALKVFTRSITKAIGSFAFLLGGLDALFFTGGIGEHDAATRAEVLSGLEALGIALDPARNEEQSSALHAVSASNSQTAVFVVPAQEDRMIALHVKRMEHTANPPQPSQSS